MVKKYFYVDSPLYKMECTAKACERYFRYVFKTKFTDLGITQGELCLLDTVVRSPEMSQIELARLLYKGRSHITQMLNSLEAKGLIERVYKTKNGRQIRRTLLTPEGEKVYKKICEGMDQKFERMTKIFEDGQDEKFIAFLEKIKEIVTEGEKVDFD